ncbi:unnamed protein product [Clonostachys rosea f. rosea IK726]|uniref:Uncharacterized protein n=1 Tax=Clonostachys rosea f. rosea IK726 TaxID=1349383 RepID=A0ACA9UIP4_BIOOC|nr:unnamed protein product [Clonostachys rosea f. rosea IK726]
MIDRTIAISTGSAPNVSDDHITVALPGCGNEGNHAAEAFTSYTDGRLSTNHFVLQIQLCQLQSEIYEIKFFGRAIPDQFSSYDHWVENMEERIRSTLNLSVSSINGAIPQWITNDAHQSQNLLHRPHPGSMVPSPASLLVATTSAISLINGYHKTIQTQRLAWTFAVVNNTFQAAIVLLYIFGNYASIIREASLENELLSALDTVMAILNLGSQRWPVIASTAMYVKDLPEIP